MRAAFPFAATLSVGVGLGGLGAQQMLTGPEWAWLWPWVMGGGFGTALLLLVVGVALNWPRRKAADNKGEANAAVDSQGGYTAIGTLTTEGYDQGVKSRDSIVRIGRAELKRRPDGEKETK